MPVTLPQTIFSDALFNATDLNRKSGSVLTQALHRPVTIVRNTEHFTLMSRELAAHTFAEANHSKRVFKLLGAAFLLLRDGRIESGDQYEWLNAFDQDEIQELIAEVFDAHRKAESVIDGWDELDAVIHEWHESAIAVLSDDLADAWQDDADEVPLTAPESGVVCA